jgi:SAM-dependent methyltransferase
MIVAPSHDELLAVWNGKYRQAETIGWGPRQRLAFSYFNPDDHYEAIVDKLVQPGIEWADIGCGRDTFPSNRPLAQRLFQRAGFVLGIDPDPNIRENAFVTERYEGAVENCTIGRRFDLITMRMVAEHIAEPDRAMAKIAELLKPGGILVIYTPNKWSPVPILTRLIPNRLHWRVKRLLWDAQARDVFPTAFKLNTRQDLALCTHSNGLHEIHFAHLDDCRTFDSYRWLNYFELSLQRLLRKFRLRYPENCLLAIYRK